MNRVKILLIALLVLSGTLSLAAAPRFGERPFIDIYQVPDNAIEDGHIRIKLSEEQSALVQSFRFQEGSLSSFGIEELDALNQEYGITSITPVFGEPAKNLKWGWRHIEWGLHLWFELKYDNKADIRDIVIAYRDLKDKVQWAEPEYKKTMLSLNQDEVTALEETMARWTPNDPRYGEQWHYNNTGQTGGTVDADIDLPEAWEIEKGHPDVIVDIQDGGFQTNHPDLMGNLWNNPGEIAGNGIDDDGNGYIDDIYGYNFVNSNATIVGHYHGTHVSGTIAAKTNNSVGVAGIAGGNGTSPGVKLMSTQVFTDDSSGGFEIAPIYGADNGAAISQNSWGYTNVGAYDQPVLDAIDYFNANGGGAVMDGGITIYAAGNGNSSGQWYPGCYSGCFAVASTNHKDMKSWYSNYDTWVDVSAPGGETNTVTSQGVLSTYTGSSYDFLQGTSMACPHTSGVAALVLSYAHRNGRTMSNTELADLIRNTTDNHYAVNSAYIGQLGTGRINAYSALLAADPTLPSCSITYPSNNQVIDLGSTITVTATATDTDGYITGVAFYVDGVFKYNDTSAPYSWVWNSTGYPGGTHTIKVIATDNSANTVERSVSITLLAPPDEGFESGNFGLYPWENSSSIPWTVQTSEVFSGTYAAKSGAISGNGSTTLSLPVVISTAGNLSFYYKVSSESNYDWLRFYIDGVQQAQWSGSAGWSAATYPVSSGPHSFSWTYSKDGGVNTGSDCGWLDHIIFPPMGIYYAPPRNLTATSGNAFVNLAWQVPAAGSPSGYKVYRNGNYLASTGGLSYQDIDVINDTNYQYYVTALYGVNASDPSNTASAYPTANPLATIIIGEGTGSQTYPIDRYYNYSGHEAIYLAAQIGTACTIKSLGFNKASGSDVSPIQAVTIYMKLTSESTLSTGNYSTDGYTQVYSGNFPNTATTGWMEVELDNLFAYNGSSNLAILTIKGNQTYTSNYPYWSHSTTAGTQARQNHSDSSQPVSLTASTNLPNLKLQAYLPQGVLYPALNLTAVGGNGFVNLAWQTPFAGTPTGYKIYRNSSLLTTVPGLSYTDNAVVNGTSYGYYVVASYSGDDAEPTETVYATPNIISSVIIGEGTSSSGTNEACPINVWYQSLHGQSVYTAAELNAKGVFGPINITEIGFNVTGLPARAMPSYVVRMGHTSANDVSNWIPSANLSTVWTSTSYQPTQTGWNMLTLATPFTWNGTDNLIVDTAFGLIGSYASTGTVQYTDLVSGYHYGRNDGTDQTNVFTGGETSTYRPNVKLALLPNLPGPMISVNPTTLTYGDVAVGASSVQQFTILNGGDHTLTGTITTPTGYTVTLAAARSEEMTLTSNQGSRNVLSFSVNAGASKIYDLAFAPTAANAYNGNVVISSNAVNNPTVNLTVTGAGFIPPTINIDNDALYANLQVDEEGTDSFTITNTGSQTLTYEISLAELRRSSVQATLGSAKGDRSIAGSTLTLSAVDYTPGTTQDWTFTVYNGSTDTEWLKDVIVSFPTGVTVNSVTNFVGGSGGDLVADNTSGNGITIDWFGESSNNYGLIQGGQTATATVNVSISSGFGGTMSLPFQIVGDIWGSDPHTISGTLTLAQAIPPVAWLSVQPLSGSIPAGQSQLITGYFSAIGMAVGTYEAMLTIHSNDPVNPNLEVSATMDVWDNLNHAPVISLPTSFEFDSNGSLEVDFGPYVSDEDLDPLTLGYSGNTNIYVAINGMNVTFTALPNWTGTETITFSVYDGYEYAYDMVTVTVKLSFLAVPDVSVAQSAGGVTVSWNAVANANRYYIYRATDPYGNYGSVPFATVYAPSTFWEDTQPLPMAFYKVIAALEELPAKN